MPSLDEMKSRIDGLEMRIAYQDQIIEDLNSAVTSQWKVIEDLTRRYKVLANRIDDAENTAGSDPAKEPPPPHY
jgi:SlyX protein